MHWSGNPVRIGPATPDEVHRDFGHAMGHFMMVSTCSAPFSILSASPCVAFRLPVDQDFTYDGPQESCGGEAAFLFRSGVSGVPIPGVQNRVSMRWRNFVGAICIYSCCTPHVGLAGVDRVRFWRFRSKNESRLATWRPSSA